MPILWPLKVPERGNAITQRKTLEIEHSCLFIHHTIWIYPSPHLILFNTPQKILTQIKLPKPNFRTHKNSGIENFKPKKILRSSQSLEIPSIPPGVKIPSLNVMPRKLTKIYSSNLWNFTDKIKFYSGGHKIVPTIPMSVNFPNFAELKTYVTFKLGTSTVVRYSFQWWWQIFSNFSIKKKNATFNYWFIYTCTYVIAIPAWFTRGTTGSFWTLQNKPG